MNINDELHKEIVKEFCKSSGKLLGTKSEYLIEKDLYLTIILKELQNAKFHENLVFKGGTCLAKAYLDYHRFSEDLDFTWKNQEIFKGKSMKQIRKLCSASINEIGNALVEISEKYGFDFKFEKNNWNYVHFKGSNKMVTFIMWFDSIQERRSMIKIEINFMENLKFPIEKKRLNPLTSNFPNNERIYFKEFLEFYDNLNYYVYDIREIFCEKVRAVLTRKTVKVRDFLDLYLISKNFDADADKLKNVWLEKIRFTIETYEKYKENFNVRWKLTKEELNLYEAEYLLLVNIDKSNFELFVTKFLNQLNDETTALFNN